MARAISAFPTDAPEFTSGIRNNHCQIADHAYDSPMRWVSHFIVAGSFAVLASCNHNNPDLAGGPGATGPFDSRGNYIEDWADKPPSRWQRHQNPPADSSGSRDLVAQNQQIRVAPVTPPPGSSGSSARSTPKPGSSTPKPSSSTASTSKPKPSSSTASTSKPKPSSSTASTSKPKPKPVASKPKPKKPTASRITIKKGDTLSGLAKRYGTSVSAIKRANGMSGDFIREGKTLVIPRK
jgi:LysM repeat protein